MGGQAHGSVSWVFLLVDSTPCAVWWGVAGWNTDQILHMCWCETGSACCWVLRRHPCGGFLGGLLLAWPSNAPPVLWGGCGGGCGGLGCGGVLSVA
jgi:hypothetical protein